MTPEPADQTDYLNLVESVDQATQTLAYVYDHIEDSDDPQTVALLLSALRDHKQAAAEVYNAVDRYLVACRPTVEKVDRKTGEIRQVPVKEMVVPGVGVIEFKRSTTRREWRHDALQDHLLELCREHDYDPVKVLRECASPSWRVSPLRSLGIDPADWCKENTEAVTTSLPSRDLDLRGRSTAHLEQEAS